MRPSPRITQVTTDELLGYSRGAKGGQMPEAGERKPLLVRAGPVAERYGIEVVGPPRRAR